MDKAIEHARSEFNTVRTGRASTALLDRIVIDYYGTPTPLNNLASIATPGAAPALRAAVRPDADQGDREGDHGVRPRV